MGDKDCFKESLRIVSIRPYSVMEVRGKLSQKGFDEELVEASISRLKEYGYLDDGDLARTLISIKFQSQGYGRRKIRDYLRKRKIPEDIIDIELTEAVSRSVSIERGVALLVRKQCRGGKDILEDKRKIFRFLAGRGFDLGECVDIISEYEERVGSAHDGERS